MKIWVGVTDKNWYEHLIRLAPEEVNFWQPSGSRSFRVLVEFADCLIGAHNGERGCRATATFDAKALELSGFALV